MGKRLRFVFRNYEFRHDGPWDLDSLLAAFEKVDQRRA
jgi:hypothetical protein